MAPAHIGLGDDRTGMDPVTLRRAMLDHLRFTRAKDLLSATLSDVYHAVSHTVRDRLVHRWMSTRRRYDELDVKRVYYLSAEYLLGRQLEANLLNLGLHTLASEQLGRNGLSLGSVLDQEADPGLGNGGLGRLAACFMDSLATLDLPAVGYGIRYEFGIFRQAFEDGRQIEHPDEWLRNGNPWEITRPESSVTVPFGGKVEEGTDADGEFRVIWRDDHRVHGVPYDTPIAGFGTNTVHTLRLWSARASEQFDLKVFNDGDYRRAVERKTLDESVSKVLYPNDQSVEGRELRFKQQYFFVCCSVHDIVRRYTKRHAQFESFPDKVAIQLNDTHPAITIVELMRILVDREGLNWDRAWELTTASVGYTNHTLLPEALEQWPVELFEKLLPRHLQIIREVDRRFLRTVHVTSKGDTARMQRMGVIDEAAQMVRMAHLSVVGSHKVNGVAELHTQLLRDRLMGDFSALWPDRFLNQTNGVTTRRWLLQCNPSLATLLTARVGPGWETDLERASGLLDHLDDAGFLEEVRRAKRINKLLLVRRVRQWTRRHMDPDAMFDVQIKRIHEYKRQLLCCLHAMWLYVRIRFRSEDIAPRAVLFAGKAAPGYARAKQIIKVINDVADTIQADPAARDQLRMLFLPNYSVSMAERVIPAADLSEQISLAGKEASGTGNMKLMMNGALTIGTLDGANVEIRQQVGEDAFFLFGLDAQEVERVRVAGYVPKNAIAASERLTAVLELLERGFFGPDDVETHKEMVRYLREEDPFLVCADFDSYVDAQDRAAEAYADPDRWTRLAVRNIAGSGRFSSDRTILGYAKEIWHLDRVPVELVTLEEGPPVTEVD
jgi:starch phosphorylase